MISRLFSAVQSDTSWTHCQSKRLGEILIERGKLDAAGARARAATAAGRRRKAGRAARHARPRAPSATSPRRSRRSSALPLVDAAGYPEFPILEERVSARFLREARALPLREDEHELALAMADPTDAYTIGAFEMVTGRDGAAAWSRFRPSSTPRSSASTAPASRRRARSIGDVETRGDELAFDADVQQLKDLASEAPVIRLVSPASSPTRSTRARPTSTSSRSRTGWPCATAIDGVLHEVESPPQAACRRR